MGPALFELYSTSLSSSTKQRATTPSKSPGDASCEPNEAKPKDKLSRKPSLKASTSLFGPRRSEATIKPIGAKISEMAIEASPSHSVNLPHPVPHRSYRVKYIGNTVLDKRYTLPMLPWVIGDIKRQGVTASGNWRAKDIFLEVTDIALKAITTADNRVLFVHPLQTVNKFAQTVQDKTCFTYLTRDHPDSSFTCHVFQAEDDSIILELFTTIRDASKEIVPQQGGNGNQLVRMGSFSALDSIMNNSQQYEVMYVGKLRVSQKRAPPSFIDEAVDKFHEIGSASVAKHLINESDTDSFRQRHGSGSSTNSLPYTLDPIEPKDLSMQRPRSISSLTTCNEYKEEESLESAEKVTPSRELRTERSLITETQSMDVAAKESIVKDLEEYKRRGGSGTHLTLSPSNSFVMSRSPSPVPTSNNLLDLPPGSLITNTQSLDDDRRASIMRDLRECSAGPQATSSDSLRALESRMRSASGDIPRTTQKQSSLPYFRSRTGSGGSSDMRKRSKFQNRPMLFLIGRLELCLISPDRHQTLLSKTFNYVSHCSQGVKYKDHFGFICRETSFSATESYVGYVFRCQSEKLVEEIMHAMKQAFHNAHHVYQCNKPKATLICDTCPMYWFHRLCCDVDGLGAEKAHAVILNAIQVGLPEIERDEVTCKFSGAKINSLQEQNELFMMLLRGMCERKQAKHSHTGGDQGLSEKRMSSIDTFTHFAKRQFHSSFEGLRLKGKKTNVRDDNLGRTRIRSATFDTGSRSINRQLNHGENTPDYSTTPESISPCLSSKNEFTFDDETHATRPRSSTISGTKDLYRETRPRAPRTESAPASQKSPLFNMFMKIGNQNKPPATVIEESPSRESPEPTGSWRKMIFSRVQPNPTVIEEKGKKNVTFGFGDEDEEEATAPKKSREELRALWQQAIKQQLILIRMDRENKKLKDNQCLVSHKRMKLDYEEVTPCLRDSIVAWDEMLQVQAKGSSSELFNNKLAAYVRSGVPRHKRGEIWIFIAEQQPLTQSEVDSEDSGIDMSDTYRELLQQLTTQQHAILVDLGRTFPKHPFYAQPLGPGQLSLFNLLKAYSLLDKEVGYCQGLSFVAGILLLHMTEDEAFEMMKHLLFHHRLRKQYKPDMSALQMQLYQLTRLLFDEQRDIYEHLERHDISPTLYAAPWFLTLFASQFPLGFVSRLFDVIFLLGMEAVFRVSLILLATHKEALLQCHSLESIMDFLRSALPSMNIIQMERVFSQVFSIDIKNKLMIYEIEYHIIREEMQFSPAVSRLPATSSATCSQSTATQAVSRSQEAQTSTSPDGHATALELRPERHNSRENMELMDQLHVAQNNVHSLESSLDSYRSTIKRLETRVRSLEDERDALLDSVNIMRKRVEKLESTQGDNEPGASGAGGARGSLNRNDVVFNIVGVSTESSRKGSMDDQEDEEWEEEEDESEGSGRQGQGRGRKDDSGIGGHLSDFVSSL